MHSLNHLACRGSVWKQQANSKDAGDWESLPPGFMHKKWEIAYFLTAKILNGKWVSLGGVEESLPSLKRFCSPALTVAADLQGSRHWVPIRQLNLSCSAGVAYPIPQQPAAARSQLVCPGRAPLVSVAPHCLPNTEIETLALPWSLKPVPVTEDHP